MEIYVATHKKVMIPDIKGYFPIQVGAINKEDLGYIKDSTGDNISCKNSNYCELTALYWIWKNSKADTVGLVHYRRLFFKNFYSKNLKKVLDEETILNYLQTSDIILPKVDYIFKYNVKTQYGAKHNIEDYNKCREIVENSEPEYLEAFDIVSQRKYFYPYNMFIMNKKLFDEYAEWLFNILFKLEQEIDISNYSEYNKRIYGFLSERLFNVWIEKNKNLKIKTIYVNNIEDKPIIYNLKNKIKGILILNRKEK